MSRYSIVEQFFQPWIFLLACVRSPVGGAGKLTVMVADQAPSPAGHSSGSGYLTVDDATVTP